MEKDKQQQPPPYQPGVAPYPSQQPGAAPFAGGFQVPPGPPAYGAPPPQNTQYGGFAPQMAGGYDSDAEGGANGAGLGGSFGEKAVRRSFIRKVYGILMCQLLLTGGIVSIFQFHEGARLWVIQNRWFYWSCFGTTLICLIAMACCESVRRNFPTNIIFLSIFTACEGLMLGCFCALFKTEAILIAVGLTCAVTVALTIFAFQTKIDFTTCGGMLCAMLVVLMIGGIMIPIFGVSKWTVVAYGSAGALIFSLYIVYDTQLMMGGSHKYSLDPEEYIFAALNIYLDVINLFMYLVMIIAALGGDD